MANLKHSKYRNTGIIFNILTRQVINEILSKKEPKCLNIIKEFFKPGTELYKEFALYRPLMENIGSKHSKNSLLNVLVNERRSLDENKLKSEKHNLIKKIKQEYNLNSLFKTRVEDYPHLANIYKIFEYKATDNPTEYTECYDSILNELKTKDVKKDSNDLFEGYDINLRLIAYKKMVQKFNEKYSNLNPKQRELAKKYLNENHNLPEFKDYIFREVQYIKNSLKEISDNNENKILKIKLNEIINLSEEIVQSKIIKNSYITAMMKYYELIERLKKNEK